jgi:hypothetical protein
LLKEASHERAVCLGEEPYQSVDISLAAQEQEEGERQDGYQSGDEPCGANEYVSGGQEEVAGRLPQLTAEIAELVAEPLEHRTHTVLLREGTKGDPKCDALSHYSQR